MLADDLKPILAAYGMADADIEPIENGLKYQR